MGKTKGRCSSIINDYRECHQNNTYSSYSNYRKHSSNPYSREAEHRLAYQMSFDHRSTDYRSADRRSANRRSADHKSADRRSSDLKSTDRRSSSLRSSDCRSADHRSADCRSANRRSADHKSADLRSSDLKSTDRRSFSHRSSDCRSADHRSADHRFANLRSADHKSADRRFSDLKSTDRRSSSHRSSDCRSADHRSADRRSANRRSADHKSADRRSSHLKSTDRRSSSHRSSDCRSADHRSADQRSADHKSADRRSADLRSTDRRSYVHRSSDRRSAERRSADLRCTVCMSSDRWSYDHWSGDHRSADHRSADHMSNDHRSADCRLAEHRPTSHRYADYDSTGERQSKQRLAVHSSVKHRIAKHRSKDVFTDKLAEHSLNDAMSNDCRSAAKNSIENRLADHMLLGYSSTEYRSPDLNSTDQRLQSPGEPFIDFFSSEDQAKCHLMKVLQIAKPYLKQLLLCIVKYKNISETLESYAMKQGKDFVWLKKNFTEEQIDIIRQNPNCNNFDLTLIFKCIELFKTFNPTKLTIEKEIISNNCIKYIKDMRNNLCHNRNYFTAAQWCDKAKSLKKLIGELLYIINIWDGEIDTISENMKIGEEVDNVMNESISERDFSYMCLLTVINSISVTILNNVTQCIFYDKNEHNFKEYFFRKGMTSTTYKNTFYKEENPILKSNSKDIQPDLILYCKIIEAWTTWHPSLKDNEDLRKELITILKQIRGVRNLAIHKMLSMYSNECNMTAHELGDSLKNLVNFIQNKELDIPMNAAKININKIVSDIDFIMSVPYPYQ